MTIPSRRFATCVLSFLKMTRDQSEFGIPRRTATCFCPSERDQLRPLRPRDPGWCETASVARIGSASARRAGPASRGCAPSAFPARDHDSAVGRDDAGVLDPRRPELVRAEVLLHDRDRHNSPCRIPHRLAGVVPGNTAHEAHAHEPAWPSLSRRLEVGARREALAQEAVRLVPVRRGDGPARWSRARRRRSHPSRQRASPRPHRGGKGRCPLPQRGSDPAVPRETVRPARLLHLHHQVVVGLRGGRFGVVNHVTARAVAPACP